jgi:hypothetical protein
MFMVEVNTPSKYTALFNLKMQSNQTEPEFNAS